MSDYEAQVSLIEAVLERQLFFVAGLGKSGTTWLELILNAHPDVCCHGEGHFADRLLPDLNGAINRYNGYLKHNNALFEEIRDSLTAFRAGGSQSDDLTLIEITCDAAVAARGQTHPMMQYQTASAAH